MKNFKDLNYRDLFNSFMVFFYNHCIVHFKEYPMFFYFLITALFNTLLLRILSVGNFLYLKPLVDCYFPEKKRWGCIGV